MSGHAYALMAAACWGLIYALEQKLLGHFSPVMLAFATSLCGTLVMAPYLASHAGDLSSHVRPGGSAWLLLGVGMLAAATNLLIITSIKHLGGAAAAILEVSYPVFVVVASYFLFGFRITPQLVFGGMLVLAGVAVIVYRPA
jgi:drug/metabolite transporter (DMT)-like permease